MKFSTTFVFFSGLLWLVSSEKLYQFSELFNSFAVKKHINSLTVISCENPQENIVLFKMLSTKYKYKTSMFTLSALKYNEQHILKDFSYIKTGLILDINCPESQEFLENCNSVLFSSSYRWLVLDSSTSLLNDNKSVEQMFQNVELRMDSDFTVAVAEEVSPNLVEQYYLYDLYNPGYKIGGHVMVNLAGYWNLTNADSEKSEVIWINRSVSTYRQRIKMDDITLRTPTVITRKTKLSSREYLTDRSDRTHDTINKFSYSIFVHVQEIHNFTMDLIVATQWFGNTYNGTDGGLSYLLNKDLADVACTSGLIKPERLGTVDYIIPIYPFKPCFIFRNPGISKGGINNIFLEPFALTTWQYVLGTCIIICLVLKFSYWIEGMVSKRDASVGFEEDPSLTGAILVTWAAFCQQGTSLVPQHLSGRITFLSLLILTLLLYNYYTSSVVSSLLSSTPQAFKTLAELAHSKLQLGVENIVYVRTLFQISKDPVVQYLYKHKIFPPGKSSPAYYSPEEGIARIREGDFAYHTETTAAYAIIQKTFDPAEICDLKEIPMIAPSTLVIMGQKWGPYSNTIAVSVRRMIEAGLVNRQLSIWKDKKPPCLSATSLVRVGILQTSPALLILSLGILISVFAWLGELFVHRYNLPVKILQSNVKPIGRNISRNFKWRRGSIIEFYN